MNLSLNNLRTQLRQQRRNLSYFEQQQAQQQLLAQLRRFSPFQVANKVGIYLHAFGEIQTTKIIQLCFQQQKQVYLPMICNMNQKLVWVKINANQYWNKRFAQHPLGMKEPMATRGQTTTSLDLLMIPLLACDHRGTRIGMGGGFYDRTLATAPQHPYRLGLAHDFQYFSSTLQRQTWDQPLDGLLTPKKCYFFRP